MRRYTLDYSKGDGKVSVIDGFSNKPVFTGTEAEAKAALETLQSNFNPFLGCGVY